MRSTRRSMEVLIAKFGGGGEYDGWEADVRPHCEPPHCSFQMSWNFCSATVPRAIANPRTKRSPNGNVRNGDVDRVEGLAAPRLRHHRTYATVRHVMLRRRVRVPSLRRGLVCSLVPFVIGRITNHSTFCCGEHAPARTDVQSRSHRSQPPCSSAPLTLADLLATLFRWALSSEAYPNVPQAVHVHISPAARDKS
jgi:hypothetical protein